MNETTNSGASDEPESPQTAQWIRMVARIRAGDPDAMGEENHREFRQATRDPAVVRAMLEDYRAGLGVDREHELEDRRLGRKVACPTLVLWSSVLHAAYYAYTSFALLCYMFLDRFVTRYELWATALSCK